MKRRERKIKVKEAWTNDTGNHRRRLVRGKKTNGCSFIVNFRVHITSY